jgi:hypothetical protein
MNLKNITAAFFLFLGTAAFASASERAVLSGEGGLKKQIQKEVRFPEFLKGRPRTEEVKLSFTIDALGKIEIISISTSNADLEKYVREKLRSMTFGADEHGQVHNMNIVFKLI